MRYTVRRFACRGRDGWLAGRRRVRVLGLFCSFCGGVRGVMMGSFGEERRGERVMYYVLCGWRCVREDDPLGRGVYWI